MCRAGGRRCPSDHEYSAGRRDSRNARRRERYAKAKAGIFTLQTMDGPLEVDTNRIDDASRFAYRNGQCFSLALGLADEIDGARVGIILRDSDMEWGTDYRDPDDNYLLRFDDGWFEDAVHAVVVSPEGNEVLDVDGFRDVEALAEEVTDIHEGSMVVMDADDLRGLLTRGQADPVQDFNAGKRMAATVVEEYIGDGTTGAQEDYADPIAYDFLSSSQGNRWGDLRSYSPEQFAGLCEGINGDFATYLARLGSEPLIADFVAVGNGDAPEGFAHTVCVVDGYVYDFTYRQVAPDAPIPLIVPVDQWDTQWRFLQGSTPEELGLMDEDEEDDTFFFYSDEEDE